LDKTAAAVVVVVGVVVVVVIVGKGSRASSFWRGGLPALLPKHSRSSSGRLILLPSREGRRSLRMIHRAAEAKPNEEQKAM